MGVTRMEVTGPRPPQFLAYLVVLCGDLNQILVLAESQNIWPLPKFWTGFATVVYVVCGSDGVSRLVSRPIFACLVSVSKTTGLKTWNIAKKLLSKTIFQRFLFVVFSSKKQQKQVE